LAELWGLDRERTEVLEAAAALGSDVPVCVGLKPAFIGGIGADLVPAAPLPPTGILLVNPGIALPTPSVYRARQGGFTPAMRFAEAPADAAELARLLRERHNDLAPAAIMLVPEIETVLAAIARLPGCLLARMSGSGATCFGLFADRAGADDGQAVIEQEHPAWWAASGALLDGQL
jgi:4-diphosphocytidyl-2-C-methyl-D-erythritol kinase